VSKHPEKEYYYEVKNGTTIERFDTFKEIQEFLGYKQRSSVTSLFKGTRSRTGYSVEKVMKPIYRSS
jgi:hypothetical protein